MQPAEKEKRFLKNWESTRQNKWRFILIRYVLLWGVLSIIPSYLFGDLLNLNETPPSISEYLVRTGAFMLFAFVAGYAQFEISENRYQEQKRQSAN